MSKETGISWADSTFNAWEGCTKVGPGCDNCYANTRNNRFHEGKNWGAGAPRLLRSDKYWKEPLQWEADHETFFAEHGHRQRVFCSSLADVFDNEAPAGQRERLFELIKATPRLDWLLLTKRIGNVNSMLPADHRGDPNSWGCGWANVWLGITVVNQEEADRDIPKLLKIPAAIRFLSMEPLLGAVDLVEALGMREVGARFNGWAEIDWVIVGGESGVNARPMVLGWAKEIVSQCQAAGVPVFMKQLGANPTNREGKPHLISDKKGAVLDEWPQALRVQQFPEISAWELLDKGEHKLFTHPPQPQSVRDALEKALKAADAERLRLSAEYKSRLDAGDSRMDGNMDWARLEGAVSVVSAIRALIETEGEQNGGAG